MGNNIGNIITIILFAIWILGIYYCRKVAMRLNMNGSNAILAGIFLPVLSWIVYFFYSYQNSTKEARIKTNKIISGATVLLVFLFAGIAYYAVRTPEYSLYKLKKAFINNNQSEIEKYFDLESVAKKYNESPSQLQKSSVDSLMTSFLEIKEENSDKSKDASAYISTGLTGKKLKKASFVFSSQNSDPLIAIKFDAEGTKLLSEITKRNIGKQLAIFLGGNLFASPSVQNEIDDGAMSISSSYSIDQLKAFVKRINEEKNGMVDGLKIKDKIVNGDTAKITLGIITEGGTGAGIEFSMVKMTGGYWRVVQTNKVAGINNKKLPAPEGEKVATFDWKYKGKDYSVNEKLYDSFYKFYNSLPVDAVFNGESARSWQEKNNDVFLEKVNGDNSLVELSESLLAIRDKNNLSENQLAELTTSFIQTIPYDYDKFDKIKAGIKDVSDKSTYPYEVLYDNKGICQDKSYLAYSLLKELGFGVAIFVFPEDEHMAIGIKCPMQYSDYDSGYCFLETTSLGNKIGVIPDILPQSNIASSNIEIGSYGDDPAESQSNPLGRVEITNVSPGQTYTGIIDTINTQKEIDNLKASINAQNGSLKNLNAGIKNEESDIKDMESKLKSLAKKGNRNDYNDYYSSYSKFFSRYKSDIKEYNGKIAIYNQAISKYNQLLKGFYQ